METISVILFFLTILNTFILVAVAGSIAKVIKRLDERSGLAPDHDPLTPVRHQRQLTYADTYLIPQPQEMEQQERPRHWDGIPRGRNWDGVPRSEE